MNTRGEAKGYNAFDSVLPITSFLKIGHSGKTISAICAGYSSCDRLADYFRSQRPNQILISFDLPDGYCVNAVAISRGMNRVDGTGISVMSHPGDLAELRLIKMGVCDDDTDRCIACEFVLDDRIVSTHKLRGGA